MHLLSVSLLATATAIATPNIIGPGVQLVSAQSGMQTDYRHGIDRGSVFIIAQSNEAKRLKFCAMVSKKGQFSGSTKVTNGYSGAGPAIFYVDPDGAVYATYRQDCDRPIGYTNRTSKGFLAQERYKVEGNSLFIYRTITVGSTSSTKKEKVASSR